MGGQRLEEAAKLLDAAFVIAERVYGASHELSRNTRSLQRGVKSMELVIDKVSYWSISSSFHLQE